MWKIMNLMLKARTVAIYTDIKNGNPSIETLTNKQSKITFFQQLNISAAAILMSKSLWLGKTFLTLYSRHNPKVWRTAVNMYPLLLTWINTSNRLIITILTKWLEETIIFLTMFYLTHLTMQTDRKHKVSNNCCLYCHVNFTVSNCQWTFISTLPYVLSIAFQNRNIHSFTPTII